MDRAVVLAKGDRWWPVWACPTTSLVGEVRRSCPLAQWGFLLSAVR